jgi:hypothetical protein
MSVQQRPAAKIYDAELLCIEAHTGTLHFSGGHQLQVPRLEQRRWWRVGQVGVLRIGQNPRDWAFAPILISGCVACLNATIRRTAAGRGA